MNNLVFINKMFHYDYSILFYILEKKVVGSLLIILVSTILIETKIRNPKSFYFSKI